MNMNYKLPENLISKPKKAYEIEKFGLFSVTEVENGDLEIRITHFGFKCSDSPKAGMVPKYAVQAIINRLQTFCDGMSVEELEDILK